MPFDVLSTANTVVLFSEDLFGYCWLVLIAISAIN